MPDKPHTITSLDPDNPEVDTLLAPHSVDKEAAASFPRVSWAVSIGRESALEPPWLHGLCSFMPTVSKARERLRTHRVQLLPPLGPTVYLGSPRVQGPALVLLQGLLAG